MTKSESPMIFIGLFYFNNCYNVLGKMRLTSYQSLGILKKYGIPISIEELTPDRGPNFQQNELENNNSGLTNNHINIEYSKLEILQNQKVVGDTLLQNLDKMHDDQESELVNFLDEKYLACEKIDLIIKIDPKIGKTIIRASKFGPGKTSQATSPEIDNHICLPVELSLGLLDFQIRKIAVFLEIPKEMWNHFFFILEKVWNIYSQYDANYVEIYPMVKASDEKYSALSASIDLDEKAFFKHPEYENLQGSFSISMLKNNNIQNVYIFPTGNIGLIVNSETLGFSILDRLQNSKDSLKELHVLGVKNSENDVVPALESILINESIDCVVIAIFGDLTFCDEVFEKINKLASIKRIRIPVVVFLNGTNIDLVDLNVLAHNLHYSNNLEYALLKCALLVKKSN